ncbi:hypothetical protein ABFS82_01G057900 [Erythranthe guttata]
MNFDEDDDNEQSPSRAPQAEEREEDEEIDDLNTGKRKLETEKCTGGVALAVETFLAELEVAAEEDAKLNRQKRPAINKLKNLSHLKAGFSKIKLQSEILDHGGLSVLKTWLEPLPDGSLPCIDVRATVLNVLNDIYIDWDESDRREQLKRSGIGKVVIFFSKSDEETRANRKVAKELVHKWGRIIFDKSTRLEEMKKFEKKPAKKVIRKSKSAMTYENESSQSQDSGVSSSRPHASRPDPAALDYAVRPQSKIDPVEVRARVKNSGHNEHRAKLNKKLQEMRAPKRKQLQATKLSVDGRRMEKYT